jgi:hypothetical protein
MFSVKSSYCLLHIFFSLALQPQFGPWPTSMKLSVSLRFSRTPWAGDQLVARPLPVHKHRKMHTHIHYTSMPWVGFEPTIPASELAKTVHASERSATVTGCLLHINLHKCIKIELYSSISRRIVNLRSCGNRRNFEINTLFNKTLVRVRVSGGLSVLSYAYYENKNRNFLLPSRFGVTGEFRLFRICIMLGKGRVCHLIFPCFVTFFVFLFACSYLAHIHTCSGLSHSLQVYFHLSKTI